MKRLVRSVFDPLPVSLSIRSLAILVTMLVAGIAISVHEYLQSGKVPERTYSIRAVADPICPPPRIEAEEPARAPSVPVSVERSAVRRTTACEPSLGTGTIGTEETPTFTPGAWVPDAETTGS